MKREIRMGGRESLVWHERRGRDRRGGGGEEGQEDEKKKKES